MSMGGVVNYTQGADMLRTMAARVPGTVTLQVRVPPQVAEIIDFAATEFDASRSEILRVALQEWLEKIASEKAAASGEKTTE